MSELKPLERFSPPNCICPGYADCCVCTHQERGMRAVMADVRRVRVRIPGGGHGNSRFWHFTFSEQWGPLLTDEWGEPVDNTPLADEAHPFWAKFEEWQRGGPPHD